MLTSTCVDRTTFSLFSKCCCRYFCPGFRVICFVVIFLAYNYFLLFKVVRVFLSNIPVVDFVCNLRRKQDWEELKTGSFSDFYTWFILITRVYILMLSFVLFNHFPLPCYITLERMEYFWQEKIKSITHSTFIMHP